MYPKVFLLHFNKTVKIRYKEVVASGNFSCLKIVMKILMCNNLPKFFLRACIIFLKLMWGLFNFQTAIRVLFLILNIS